MFVIMRKFFVVCPSLRVHVDFEIKFHLTHAALLWLLSSMDTEMCLQGRTVTKLLVAQLTIKGLLSSMETKMFFKVRTFTKLLVAQLTLKGLLSSMDTEMYLKD